MRWKSDMASIDIKPDLSEEDLEKWEQYLMKDERFRPFRVEFTAPYDKVAFYLEHGTGPAKVSKKEPPRADGKTAKERIQGWADTRYRSLNKKELNQKKNDLYHQIMEAGTPPRPFIRPAVSDVMEFENLQKIFNEGGGTKEVAQNLVNRMVYYLTQNRSVTAGSDEDSIVNHIEVMPIGLDEGDVTENNHTVEEILTTWEAIDVRNESEHAQNLSRYRGKKARR